LVRGVSLELGGAWFWLLAMERALKNAAGSQVEDDEDDAAALGRLNWCWAFIACCG
jgi:hypothetical protein